MNTDLNVDIYEPEYERNSEYTAKSFRRPNEPDNVAIERLRNALNAGWRETIVDSSPSKNPVVLSQESKSASQRYDNAVITIRG